MNTLNACSAFLPQSMGLLGRFREYWPWTKEEQQFDKVMIGENYCGKLRDEWSDAPSDPLESIDMMKSDKKTKSSSRSRKPVFTEVSSIDKERTVRFKSAAAEGPKSKEGERKFPVQRSSHEDVNDLRSVLDSLARLGEELIPLLLTLSKMGEEMYGATAASHHQAGEALSTSTSAIEAAKRPAATPTSSTQSERGSSNTITESNKNTNKSRSNPSASRKSSQDSSTTSSMTHATPPTPTTSSSNGSAAPSSQLSKGSTQEEVAFGAFKRLCAIHGLLKRPVGTGEHDVCDGINDEATLR